MNKKRLNLRSVAKMTVACLAVAAMFIFAGCDKETDSITGTIWTYQNSNNIITVPDYSYTDMQFYAGGTVWFGNADLTGEKPSISNARAFSYTYSGNKISIKVNLKEYSGSVNGNLMKLYANDNPSTEITLSLKWKLKK